MITEDNVRKLAGAVIQRAANDAGGMQGKLRDEALAFILSDNLDYWAQVLRDGTLIPDETTKRTPEKT